MRRVNNLRKRWKQRPTPGETDTEEEMDYLFRSAARALSGSSDKVLGRFPEITVAGFLSCGFFCHEHSKITRRQPTVSPTKQMLVESDVPCGS